MIVLILYWFFTSMYAIGQGYYMWSKLRFFDFFMSILTGWFLIPFSLGTERQKNIEED